MFKRKPTTDQTDDQTVQCRGCGCQHFILATGRKHCRNCGRLAPKQPAGGERGLDSWATLPRLTPHGE